MKKIESAKVGVLESLSKLSPERRALLARRLKEKRTGAGRTDSTPERGKDDASAPAGQATGRERHLYFAPPVARAARGEEIPLSFAQQRLWFIDQLEPGTATYNVIAAVRLTGSLHVAALEESFNEIERRHETLRTRFTGKDGTPVQTVLPARGAILRIIDLQELDEQARQDEGLRLAAEQAQQPFDLAQGRLCRAALIRLGGREEHALLLTMHHIVSDGWSMGVLVREMMALYRAFSGGAAASPLTELPVQYTDYAYWQREWLQGEVLESQLRYWKQQLEGAPPVLDLPTDRPRPPVPTSRGARQTLVLPESLTESLKSIARSEGASLFMVLLAAFKVLLYRYSGQADIVVGTPIANRGRSELEGLIGFFVNTLALRTDLSKNPSFKELLGRVRDVALGAYAHQDIPFERLVEELNPERLMSRQPLFQVMFVLQNAPTPVLETPSLTLQPYAMEYPVAKFDLTLTMGESSGVVFGSLEYSTDLFDTGTASGMLKHLEVLLTGVAENPDRRILDLPLISEDDKQQLQSDWNRTSRDYALTRSVSRFFEAQVEATPEAVAACGENEQVSYRELNGRANQLAHYLQKQGVGPDTRVGICIERSVEMLVAVLGVLKAGGAYVPLDPAYPQERLAFMLEDSQARMLLTQERLVKGLPPYAGQLVCLDTGWEAIAAETTEEADSRAEPDNLCYVIYTSGSTGQPKGVAMTHRALSNLIEWQHNELRLEPGAITLQLSSLSFDASFNEMFSTWVSGGTLVLIPEESRRDPVALMTLLARQGVERLLPPYAALQQLADSSTDEGRAVLKLREILSTAEQLHLSPSIVRMMSGMKDCVLHNEYGPSETHVVTAFTLAGAPDKWPALPPIGRPIANTQIYLLDTQMQSVPVGVYGELYVGGASLARGYLNKPEMTAERFVPDPCGQAPGARLYKTGDLARYLPDGNIEYVGRIDQQVKIRGYRVEPGEIEVALKQHPLVSDAAVIVREDEPGQKRLIAYWVTRENAALKVSDLFGFLRQRLPEYMIPSAYLELEALPLSPNGKIDRRALPAPDRTRPGLVAEFVAPTTIEEEIVAGIWANVLKLERVGVRDNFFELGGHSLLATQVVSRIRDTLQVEIPLRRMFEAPTVGGLAAFVKEALREGAQIEQSPPVVRRALLAPPPVSFTQQRLWFTDQLEPGSSTYNIPAAIRLDGRLDVAALERSLNEVVRRHEALRTNFRSDDGKPVQVIHKAEPLTLPVIDLSALCAPDEQMTDRAEAEALRLTSEEVRRGFDLRHDSLLRVSLVRVSDDLYVLLLTMHHIISDAWSMNVLVREVTALYEAYRDGQESPLRELQIQYADYALWQREWLTGEVLERELGYWKNQLAGAPKTLELPLDRPRAAARAHRAGAVAIELSRELTEGLQALSRREGATLFMVLLAGFKALLSRYSGQRDIVVGTSVAGRTRGELEDLIGCFINTLAMRTEVAGELNFSELIRRVREVVIDGQTHQDMPFERLVEELSPGRSLDSSPVFQVMFALDNTGRASGATPIVLAAEPVERDMGLEENALPEDVPVAAAHAPRAKYDLNLVLGEAGGGISGALEYDTDLFDEKRIKRLGSHYVNLLQAVVADAGARIADLPLMSDAERRQILDEWNDTQRPYPRELCIHQLFEEQAARTPLALALTDGAEQMSYEELNGRANQVAHHLRRLGVKPETTVAICMERSLEMVSGLLGILKAGAAYVPLDISYPHERLQYMLEDSGAALVLTQQRLLSQLENSGARAVCLDTDGAVTARESRDNPFNRATPENLAYVIYTSGSTGRPKGVMVPHRGLVNYLCWARLAYPLTHGSGTPVHSSLAFDLTVTSLLCPLLTGRPVTLLPETHTVEALADLLRAEPHLSLIKLTPSHLDALNQSLLPQELKATAQALVIGGEPLRAEQLAVWREHAPETRLINEYGPTETVVGCCVYEVMPEEEQHHRTIPIGRPIANTRLYVLGQGGEPCPVGVTGELYVGGAGVARGYLGRPALTAEKFVPDALGGEAGERLYRTGDLARYREDGVLEFMGRGDEQVKVRGYRIELGEIESVLLEHAGVRESVVLVREDVAGEKRLAAFVVGTSEIAPAGTELRQYLKEKLPEYMVPSVYVSLERLPLTANGKVDRQVLLSINDAQPALESRFVAPRTPVEEEMAQIWSNLLGVEQVGIHDNFFELGGHSILLIQLHSRLSKSYNVKISLRDLFDAPTIAEMTLLVAQGQIEQQDSAEVRQMLDELKQLSPEEVKALLDAEEQDSVVQEV
jgi:amino acid adenylation domain-containing protein